MQELQGEVLCGEEQVGISSFIFLDFQGTLSNFSSEQWSVGEISSGTSGFVYIEKANPLSACCIEVFFSPCCSLQYIAK